MTDDIIFKTDSGECVFYNLIDDTIIFEINKKSIKRIYLNNKLFKFRLYIVIEIKNVPLKRLLRKDRRFNYLFFDFDLVVAYGTEYARYENFKSYFRIVLDNESEFYKLFLNALN